MKITCEICKRKISHKNQELYRHTGIGDFSYWHGMGRNLGESAKPFCFGSYANIKLTPIQNIERALKISKIRRLNRQKEILSKDYNGNEERRTRHLNQCNTIYYNLDKILNKMLQTQKIK